MPGSVACISASEERYHTSPAATCGASVIFARVGIDPHTGGVKCLWPTIPVVVVLTLGGLPLCARGEHPNDAPGVATPIHDPSGKVLDAFHASLRQTAKKKKKTRVLQFGASHTAADIFTGHIRQKLQKRFGDGGHGFFMPARPWKSYRHRNLRFENPRSRRARWEWDRVCHKKVCHEDGLLGLAGMSVRARSRRQWQVFETRNGTTASQLEIWYHRQKRGGDLVLSVDGGKRKRIRTRTRKRQQAGLGIYERPLKFGPHTFKLEPRGNGEVRLFGGTLERQRPGVVVDTLGINGARAVSMLDWNFALWSELVRRREPALIVLAYGTNEASDQKEPIEVYESNLRKVLRRVRRAAPDASCVLFGPTDRPVVHREHKRDPDPWFSRRERTDLIIDTQRKVSAELGCGFFDAVAAMGGRFSVISWADMSPRYAYGDYVHLTARGYRRLADLFLESLMEGYDE